MDRQIITAKVVGIFKDNANVDMDARTDAKDLPLRSSGIDSVGFLRALAGIEEAFNIRLGESEISSRSTFSQLVEVVCRKLDVQG
jgi:acyl carrier protein